MKLVIFGLTISSSWGNGHATLWRGLLKAMVGRGHRVVFFERDLPYYAGHRDFTGIPGVELLLYENMEYALAQGKKYLSGADVGMVTSYCHEGVAFSELVLSSNTGLKVFYDLDSPVTLEKIRRGQPVTYIGPSGLREFDLVLSYTGGATLHELKDRLGARLVRPLYGSVDPEFHHPVRPGEEYRADLSYLGTYAEDRQPGLNAFFIEPSLRLPEKKFLLGGSLYPEVFPWTKNIFFVRHVPPPRHPEFYCSSVLTLNITRRAMAETGYCPSGRLFEAAACGTPIISDYWEGLEEFFSPGREIIIVRSTEDVVRALGTPVEQLGSIARAARERTLDAHTAGRRAGDLEAALESAYRYKTAGGAIPAEDRAE